MPSSRGFLDESIEIIRHLHAEAIDRMVIALGRIRDGGGRLFGNEVGVDGLTN